MLPEFPERTGTLQCSADLSDARLYPTLLRGFGSAFFQNGDRSRQLAGFAGRIGEWNRLQEISTCDRLDRCLEAAYRVDELPKSEISEHSGQQNSDRYRGNQFPQRVAYGGEGGAVGFLRQLVILSNPIGKNAAELVAKFGHGAVKKRCTCLLDAP